MFGNSHGEDVVELSSVLDSGWRCFPSPSGRFGIFPINGFRNIAMNAS